MSFAALFKPFIALSRYRLELRIESLALLGSLFFVLFCNTLFWQEALGQHDMTMTANWLLAAALLTGLAALHALLFLLLFNRWTAKPLLALLLVTSGAAVYFMNRYHVYLDPSMLRNVLATDVHEAGDLLNWAILPHLLLYTGLPLWFLWRTRIMLDPPGKSILRRLLALLMAALTAAGALLLVYQDLASMMRNNRDLRYLITPGNYLYSMGRVVYGSSDMARGPRQIIGSDARQGDLWPQRKKPVLFVFVLGETARAANWQLSGYPRPTTPRLAEWSDLINFASVSSCGSNTEVSVPCLFSPWGRRQYDENRIRSSESLLDVIARAGLKALWVDNQSGCKGVCAGVGEIRPKIATLPTLCDGERCLDEALPKTLAELTHDRPESLFVVLHQMGNHGPAYFKRYPDAFKHFTPACENPDLAQCSRESIVNAYDNAIRYTDHVLADTLNYLKQQKTHDAALIYVSDHGESLGENGLFLHGIPQAIAPAEQLKVPMIMWFSPEYASSMGIDISCLRQRATQATSHDNLFHTTLGLLDINSTVYESKMDLSASCRNTRFR